MANHFGYNFAVDLVDFALVWKMDTTLLTCEYSCILCPIFENFCPNNGQFFSIGVRPHPLHPHAMPLWSRASPIQV